MVGDGDGDVTPPCVILSGVGGVNRQASSLSRAAMLKQPHGFIVRRHRPADFQERSMLWAGLIAFVLALVLYVALEPSLWAVLLNATELLGVIALFCLVCLSELFT